MKITRNLFSLFIIFIGLFTSCQTDLIPSPNIEQITGGTNTTTSLTAPQNLVASHGGCKKIILTWDEVTGATKYNIYSAENAFSTPVQIGETKDNSRRYEITESSGKSKYYLVTAVNYKKEVSAYSSKAFGSTLATPIITNIQNSESGTCATVSWWMDNCSEKTYLKSVRYEIECYKEDKTTLACEPLTSEENNFEVTFNNLKASTKYYYQVKAYTTNDTENFECSDLLDSETAHKLIPNAVENFTATQGINKDQIVLKWKIPEFVDYSLGQSTYEQHPVYFTIERKETDQDDSEYQKIAVYVGSIKGSEYNGLTGSDLEAKLLSDADKLVFYFSSEDTSANSSNITTVTNTDQDATSNTEYPAYISGSVVNFTDSYNLNRGIKYSYRIQSYVDDSSKEITSGETIREAEGWLISTASIKANASYTKNELETTFEKIDISFNFNFDTMGLPDEYKYIITAQRTPFPTEGEPNPEPLNEEIILQNNSVSFINSQVLSFTSTALTENEGYIKYTIYIVSPDVSTIPQTEDECYLKAISPNSITVTSDAEKIPQINDFEVDDGYANKYVLTWEYDDHCSYSISWSLFDSKTEELSNTEETLVVNPEDSSLVINENDDGTKTAIYSHSATSGDCRLYSITADNGLQTKKVNEDEHGDNIISRTLGTPEVTIDKLDYDSIVVKWNSVQKACDTKDDFAVTAHYSDSSSELLILDTETPNTVITKDDDTSIFTCTITKPDGYNNALLSGKPINLTVTAKSAEHETETTSTTQIVRTVGPALTNTTCTSQDANNILLNWKKIEGAKGYIIQRVRYTDSSASADKIAPQTDTYYYNTEDDVLQIQGETVDENRGKVSITNGIYTLIDTYKEASDQNSSYELNQSMISWGLPYGYIVLPISNSGSSSDFTFDSLELSTEEGASKVLYSNLTDTKGATTGYGLNTWAHKAESASIQTIEWDLPYHKNLSPTIYRRTAGSTSNTWYEVTNATAGDTKTNISPSEDERTEAFEYIIAYSKSDKTISLPESLVNGTSGDKGLSTLETDDEHYDYTDRNPEKLNKGYLLAVGFSACYGGTLQDNSTYAEDDNYYSEKVNWNQWDYNSRSIGPDSAYISVKNYNISGDWNPVANLDSNLHFESANTVDNTTIKNSGDVAMYLAPENLATAESVTNGTRMNTEGPLMVLRDAKHYYSLTLTRGTISQTIGNDDSVYAYRQITDVELVRSALLVMAYGFYMNASNGDAMLSNVNSKMKYQDDTSFSSSNGGNATFGEGKYSPSLSEIGKYAANVNFTNYSPSMKTPSEQYFGYIKITTSLSAQLKGTSDYYLNCFRNNGCTVEASISNSDIPFDTSISFTMTTTGSGNLTLKIGNTTLVNTSSEEVRRKWFPVQYNDDHSWIKSSTYGWWQD